MARRLIAPWVAVALVAPVLQAGPSVAAIDAELCFGQVPTIVGVEEEQQVVGTDGPDVVIAHGGQISTGDGDDLVCVIGRPKVRQPPGTLIYAGSGNDRVDNSRSLYDYTTYLGDGADEYVGGPAREYVSAFQDSQTNTAGPDRAVDVIKTARADDWVFSGGGSDVVDLGDGRDRLYLRGLPDPDGAFLGGLRSDFLVMRLLDPQAHSWTLSNRSQQLLRDGQLIGGWDSFNQFEVNAGGGPVQFRGSDQAETLSVPRPRWSLDVRMAGGDDNVELIRGAPADHRISGGKGRDKWTYSEGFRQGFPQLPRDIHLDLRSGVVRDARQDGRVPPTSFRAINFEHAHVRNPTSGKTVMRGTSDPNVLSTSEEYDDAGATMYGMAGDDVIIGSYAGDVLIGGSGVDTIYGQRGIDRCEAEVERGCEQ